MGKVVNQKEEKVYDVQSAEPVTLGTTSKVGRYPIVNSSPGVPSVI